MEAICLWGPFVCGGCLSRGPFVCGGCLSRGPFVFGGCLSRGPFVCGGCLSRGPFVCRGCLSRGPFVCRGCISKGLFVCGGCLCGGRLGWGGGVFGGLCVGGCRGVTAGVVERVMAVLCWALFGAVSSWGAGKWFGSSDRPFHRLRIITAGLAAAIAVVSIYSLMPENLRVSRLSASLLGVFI